MGKVGDPKTFLAVVWLVKGGLKRVKKGAEAG